MYIEHQIQSCAHKLLARGERLNHCLLLGAVKWKILHGVYEVVLSNTHTS